MRPIVHATFIAVLLATSPPAVERTEMHRSCEPSGPIDMYARTIEIRGNGSAVTAAVELTILPHRGLEDAVIRGTLANGTGFDGAFGIPDKIVTLRRRVARKIQYAVPLANGKSHELFFHLEGEGPEGSVATSAYLRINLDPEQQPDDLGNVIQYRAVMRGVTP